MKLKKSPGLTLLEMLLALSLMAIVLTLLMTQYFQSEKSHRRVATSISERQQLRLIRNLISSDLRSMVALPNLAENNPLLTALYFQNQESGGQPVDMLAFFVHRTAMQHPEAAERDPELHEIHYEVYPADDADKPNLLYRVEGYYVDSNLQEEREGKKRLISDRLKKLNFQFLKDATGSWEDKYTEKKKLPLAVKVEIALEFEGELQTDVFEINIRPPVGADWEVYGE